MKNPHDKFTFDLFEKKPVGRPRKQSAKTPAQRMKAYREKQKFNMLISVTRDENSK